MTIASAERDLEFALAEQSRCTKLFQRAIGTSGELSAYASLVGATRIVSVCDQTVREARASAEPFALTLLADATAPAEARAEVARRLGGQVDLPVVQTVELLVSETVTNAVMHGAGNDVETVDLAGRLGADRVRMEVTNAGPAFDDAAELPPATDAAGRGLFLVAALSRAWGRRHTAGMTSVWFEVAT